AGLAVECDPPGIAQAERVHLVAARAARAVGPGVAGGDAVVGAGGEVAVRGAAAAIHVDAQQLAERAARVLGVVLRVAAAAAVARGDVPVALRAGPDAAGLGAGRG